MEFHNIPLKEVMSELSTSEKTGLSTADAKKRIDKYGMNRLKEAERESPLKMFLGQFNSPVVWVLIAAVIVSGLLAEWIDAIAIAGSFLLHLAVLYTPLAGFFKAVPLTLEHWTFILVGVAIMMALGLIAYKILRFVIPKDA